jgi:hypothetical protein
MLPRVLRLGGVDAGRHHGDEEVEHHLPSTSYQRLLVRRAR